MNYTPFTSCMNPQRIYNRNIHDFDYVPCRHCLSCQNQYAQNWFSRVADECQQHRYSYFFTLTYDNEFLPRISVFQDLNGIFQISADARLSSMIPSLPFNPFFDEKKGYDDFDAELPAVQNDLSDYSDIPTVAVLSKQDIVLFLKRLRKNIAITFKNLTNEQRTVRYFIAGEYGPSTYRPHYHGILWYDSQEVHSQILELIIKSWGYKVRESGHRNRFASRSFCHRDRFRDTGLRPTCGLVAADAPGYVAKYVSGNSSIPQVLQLKQFKPFHLSSKAPTIGNFENRTREVFEHYENWWSTPLAQRDPQRVIEHDEIIYNKQVQCMESRSVPFAQNVLDCLWCKCFEYSQISDYKKFLTYDFVRHYSSEFQESRQIDGLTGFQRLKMRHPDEWNMLNMDKPANQLASKKAYKACELLGCSVEHYLDIYAFYLKEKQLYKLRQFYLTQQKIIEDFPTSSLVGAYPFLFEQLPEVADNKTFSRLRCYDPNSYQNFYLYRNPGLNLLISLGYKVSQFYPDFYALDEKFTDSLRLDKQSYYNQWRLINVDRNFKSNKTKRKNNMQSDFRTID